MENVTQNYAQVWKRVVAFIIDFAILFYLFYWVAFAFGHACTYFSPGACSIRNPADQQILLVIQFLIWLSYFIFFENSRLHATPGKLITKICIEDTKSGVPGFLTLLTRNIYKLLPIALDHIVGIMIVIRHAQEYGSSKGFYEHALTEPGRAYPLNIFSILVILFIIGAFSLSLITKRKQALHDLMAGTIVVKTSDNPLKRLYLRIINFINFLRKARFSGEQTGFPLSRE